MNKAITKPSWKGWLDSVAVLTLLAFVGNLTAVAQARENPRKKLGLSLKLSGGFGYLLNGAGDINDYRQGQQEMLADYYSDNGYTSTFNWPRPWFLPDLTADIIVHVGSHFGFGFGSGLIPGSSKGSFSIDYRVSETYSGYSYSGDTKYDYERNHKLTAVPLKFDLYFFQSLGKADRFTFFAHAGAGYYLGKIKYDYPYHRRGEAAWDYGYGTGKYLSDYQAEITGNSKCNTWGYHGGLGLEFKMSRAISFGAELSGRYVNFKNWEGDLSASWKVTNKHGDEYSWWYESSDTGQEKLQGFLWTYQFHDDKSQNDYTYMMLFEEQPTNRFLKNTRKSAINLNSLSLALSLRIHFDLF